MQDEEKRKKEFRVWNRYLIMTIAGGMIVASDRFPIKVSLAVMILTTAMAVCGILSIVKSINK